MKKLNLLYAAAMLLSIISCQQSELFEDNAPTQGALRQITVQASMGDGGSDTRASMTPDGEDFTNATWISAWEDGDKLGAWTTGETSFSEFNILPGYDDVAKTASFTGSISTTAQSVRFIYPYNNQTVISSDSYSVDISNQVFYAGKPFEGYGKDKPMISELLNVSAGEVENVKLRNLCAGMEYKLAFTNIDTQYSDIRVTDIVVTSSSICAVKTLNLNNGELTDNASENTITISILNSPKLNSYTGATRYSVIGAVFPFNLAAGSGAITVDVHTNYGVVKITKTNTSTEEIDFYLGAHHYINLDVDMSVLNKNYDGYWSYMAATAYASGEGTQQEPWVIKTPEQLAKLWNNMNGNNNHGNIEYFILGNDIDLSGMIWGSRGGPYYEYDAVFNGIFDGRGYSITGLYINNRLTIPQGLFNYLAPYASIKYVNVEGSINCSDQYVGGIVGYSQGDIEGCSFSGHISTSGDYVGGIAGYTKKAISKCHNKGTIKGSNWVGGIVGQSESNTSINSCSNIGNIIGTNEVGGIAGQGEYIDECHNTGNIAGGDYIGGIVGKTVEALRNVANCYNTGIVSGSQYIAGIVGYNKGENFRCYNTGKVSGTFKVAGIAAYAEKLLWNCYNTGDIDGTEEVGGLAGLTSLNEIKCCYNTGKVTGIKSGSLAGYSVGATVNHCYALYGSNDDMVGGSELNSTISYTKALTEAEMKGATFRYDEDDTTWVNMLNELNSGSTTTYWLARTNDYPWLGF